MAGRRVPGSVYGRLRRRLAAAPQTSRQQQEDASGQRTVREHAVEQHELPGDLQVAGAEIFDEEQSSHQECEGEGAVVEAAGALAGERGDPPAVRRVRGEGGAREPGGEKESCRHAERRDEDVVRDPPLEGRGEQERQGHEPGERGQGAPRDADEDRGPDPARERGRLDVPIADVALQHPAPGRDHEHEGQDEGGEEQHPRAGPALAAGGREPLLDRRVRQLPGDAEGVRSGVPEHRPRQRRRAAFQEAPCGALAPRLGDARQHLPGPEGDQLRLLDVPLVFGAAFIERRAFRRDRLQLRRPAVGRRQAQGVE